MQHGYSVNKLETDTMPLKQRCNYAGPLGTPIPTRSLASALGSAWRALARLRRRA